MSSPFLYHNVTMSAVCPPLAFERSAAVIGGHVGVDIRAKRLVWAKGTLHWANSTRGNFRDVYEQHFATTKCKHAVVDEKLWPRSKLAVLHGQDGLLLNIGEGTTGTRFLHCVVMELGIRGFHSGTAKDDRLKDCTKTGKVEHEGDSCTSAWDEYEMAQDSLTASALLGLLSSHPGSLMGGALMSLRQPDEWRHSRVSAHEATGAKGWGISCPCGVATEHNVHLIQGQAPTWYFLCQVLKYCAVAQTHGTRSKVSQRNRKAGSGAKTW